MYHDFQVIILSLPYLSIWPTRVYTRPIKMAETLIVETDCVSLYREIIIETPKVKMLVRQKELPAVGLVKSPR